MIKYEFVWAAPPAALAGRQRTAKIGSFEIEIGNDRIVARTDFTDTPEPKLRAEAAAIVENLARAIAFQEKREVALAPASVTRTSESGSAEVAIAPTDAVGTFADKVRAVVHGPAGEVTSDTAEDEFNAARSLGERATRSAPLQQMLDHMQRFYTNPEKKLAPLYNILQAAETQFGGRKKAAAALKIPSRDLNRLGRICNDPKIINARHPGKGTTGKRPATPQELELCQTVAETVIRRFADTV